MEKEAGDQYGTIFKGEVAVVFYENEGGIVTGFFSVACAQPQVARTVTFEFDRWSIGKIRLPIQFARREAEYRKIVDGLTTLARVIYEDGTQSFLDMVKAELEKSTLEPPTEVGH